MNDIYFVGERRGQINRRPKCTGEGCHHKTSAAGVSNERKMGRVKKNGTLLAVPQSLLA